MYVCILQLSFDLFFHSTFPPSTLPATVNCSSISGSQCIDYSYACKTVVTNYGLTSQCANLTCADMRDTASCTALPACSYVSLGTSILCYQTGSGMLCACV